MKQDIQTILVIGANGSTGQIICKLLDESPGYRPIAMVRDDSQKENFENQGIRTVTGDLEGDFEHAFKNIDRVIFAAGSGGSTGKDKTIAVDQEGAKKSIDFAIKYHCQKFVMLSSMGADEPNSNSEIYDYLKAKHEADEYLKASGMDYTIVRPGALTDKSASGKITAGVSLDKKGEISRENVALTIIDVLATNIATNAVIEILDGDDPIAEALTSLEETVNSK
jgi:uncharacterized protein YbjT (DUF2867 family)